VAGDLPDGTRLRSITRTRIIVDLVDPAIWPAEMSPIILTGLSEDFYPGPPQFLCGLANILHQEAYDRPSIEVVVIWRLRAEDFYFSPTRQPETRALMTLVNDIHSKESLKKVRQLFITVSADTNPAHANDIHEPNPIPGLDFLHQSTTALTATYSAQKLSSSRMGASDSCGLRVFWSSFKLLFTR